MRSKLAHRLEREDLGTLRAQLLSLNGSETRLDSFVLHVFLVAFLDLTVQNVQ